MQTKKEKVDLLRKHNSTALSQMLIINFDESIVSMLPEGDVPYTPNDAPVGTDHTRLEQEYRGLYRFFKGGQDKLPSLKRESMFVQLLEGLVCRRGRTSWFLLRMVVSMISISESLKQSISEAFPSIEWGGRS